MNASEHASMSRDALNFVRQLAAQHGCRIEICSDDGEMPVSASNYARTAYGFGRSVEEATTNLVHRPRKIP